MELDIVETQEPLDREGDRAGDVTASSSVLCPPAVVLRERTDIDHAKPRLYKTPPQLGRRHLVAERHSTSGLCRSGGRARALISLTIWWAEGTGGSGRRCRGRSLL